MENKGNNTSPLQEKEQVTMHTEAYAGKKAVLKKRICIGIGIFVGIVLIMGIIVWIGNRIRIQHNINKYKNQEFVQSEMLRYLEGRYGEKFVMQSFTGYGYSYSNYAEMKACPEGQEDEEHTFQVQGYYNKDGTMEFYDTYVMVRLLKDYEAYLDPIIGEYFDEYKFYMTVSAEWVTNSLPPDTTLEDLWKMSAGVDYPMPKVYLCIAPMTNIDLDILKEICLNMQKFGFRGKLKIWKVRKWDIYSEIAENRWAENIVSTNHKDIYTVYIYSDKVEYLEDELIWD